MSFFQCTCSFFPEFHSWVQFSLAGEIIFEGDVRRDREEVFTNMQRFLCRRIAWLPWLRRRREEELGNAHDDWVPTRNFPSLIGLENVRRSTNLLNPAHAQIKHTMNCILSNNVVCQTPCKFVDAAVFVSIFTQCEDKKKCCVGLTTPSLLLLLLPSNMVGYSFTRLKVLLEMKKIWTSVKWE